MEIRTAKVMVNTGEEGAHRNGGCSLKLWAQQPYGSLVLVNSLLLGNSMDSVFKLN